ncbi:Spermidine synthase [Plecturocebus cupreus]
MEPDSSGLAASGLTAIPEGWFRQTCRLWSGQALSLLHDSRLHYQNVLVFCSKTYSNVLVLDVVTPGTERDEFSY